MSHSYDSMKKLHKWLLSTVIGATTLAAGSAYAAAGISVDKTALAFGSSPVNVATANQTITVTNTGTSTGNPLIDNLTLTSLQISGNGQFKDDYILTGTCSVTTPITPGSSCTILVSFRPTVSGVRDAVLSIFNNVDSGTTGGRRDVTLSGMGTTTSTAPAIEVMPGSLAFGNQTVGTSTATQLVTVKNIGTANLLVNNATINGINLGDFYKPNNTDNCSGFQIAPGATCTIAVYFNPVDLGARAATLTISHNAGNFSSPVGLSGTGIKGTFPGITESNSFFNYPTLVVGQTSEAQQLTLYSTGTAPLSITGFGLSSSGDFVRTGGSCATGPTAGNPIVLQPSQNCTVLLAFKPLNGGNRTDNFLVTSNASSVPLSIRLSGTATIAPAPIATLSDTALLFNNTVVGSTSASKTVTLTNSGNAVLNVTGISLSAGNTNDFAQIASTCPNGGGTLAIGASCTMTYVFKPTATNARNATVSIIHNAANVASTVTLSGTGIGTPTPAVTLSSGSFTYDNTYLGSSSQNKILTVTNSGTAPLSFSGSSISGANVSDFVITGGTCPVNGVLDSGASCTVAIRFTPTAEGQRSANVVVTTALGTSTASLAGFGMSTTPTPQLRPVTRIAPMLVSFNDLPQGSASTTQIVSLSNIGTSPLTLSNISLVGNNNAQILSLGSATTCTNLSQLSAGQSCQVVITFNPATVGTYTASLQYLSDGGSGAIPVTATVTGSTPPNPGPTPPSPTPPSGNTGSISLGGSSNIAFSGSTNVGSSSSSQLITLSNNSGQMAQINSIGVTGPFNLGNNTCGYAGSSFTLASGASCQVYVYFAPTTAGTQTGTVSFAMANGTTQTSSLQATAVGNSNGNGSNNTDDIYIEDDDDDSSGCSASKNGRDSTLLLLMLGAMMVLALRRKSSR